MGFESLPLEVVQELFQDKRFTIRKSVPWKGNPELLPDGTRKGLAKSIVLSKACRGIRGVVIDPRTGQTQTRKSLAQRKLSKSAGDKGS